MEDFLHDTEITEEDIEPSTVETFDHCIVFYENFVNKCRNKWQSCRDALNDLEKVTPIMTMGRDSQLRLDAGNFESDDLNRILNNGISLPKIPEKTIYLPENVELEALSFSICNDIVMNNLKGGRHELTPSDVRNFYGRREIPLRKVKQALTFLNHVGACREQPDGSYEFSVHDIKQIAAVENKLRQQPVDEYLDNTDDNQAGLGDFTD